MHFTVGGRVLDLTMEQVCHAMQTVQPEPIQKHVVEMFGTVYPPKQVLAAVSGFDRTSFTTMEAQRVLTRLGFVCRRDGYTPAGEPAWVREGEHGPTLEERLAAVEAAMVVQREAIANLAGKIERAAKR